jgi:hypothetical protein
VSRDAAASGGDLARVHVAALVYFQLMPRILKRSLLALAVSLLVPAGALAAAKPPPVVATASLKLPTIYVLHGDAVTVQQRPVRVQGYVRPYVPGQWVKFKAVIGNTVLRSARLRIKPVKGHNYGAFSLPVVTAAAGIVHVSAVHSRTRQMAGFRADRRYATLVPSAHFGSTGPFVQLIQQRLAALHFYIPQTGVYDGGTGLALDAYHRLLGWGTSQALDGKTISYLLNGWGEFKLRFPSHGRHAEGNLSKQLLALADGSKVQLIFPISSGKPSTPTILGDFHVYQKTPGYLPDGMYYSNFFIGGYAIHGYNPAPDYPASHGCMRLPIVDAITAYNWLAIGDWVDVYY